MGGRSQNDYWVVIPKWTLKSNMKTRTVETHDQLARAVSDSKLDDSMTIRSELQNASMHLYFRMLADAFNLAGLDMKKTLKPEIDIPWSSDRVKEFLWRPVQEAMLNKESTTELTTRELG